MNPPFEHIRPIPENEISRLSELTDFDPDYTNLKQEFEHLTALAAKIAETDISLVNLIDSFTQWSVSNYGLDIDQMPREESICQYTILEKDHFEVRDLSLDERMKDFFYVRNPLNLRYYFGIPLTTPNGHNIGALCVLDKKTKKLSPEKIELLKLIANEVVEKLINLKILHSVKSELDDYRVDHLKTAHDIRGPLSGITGIIDIIRKKVNKSNPEDVLDYIEMIDKTTKAVLSLSEEILNREKSPKEDSFDLISFKDKLEKLYLPQAKAKNIFFKVTTGNANTRVLFTKNKMLHIAGNLISNAIKFSSDYGTVTVKLELEVKEDAKTLIINVSDNGNGLSEQSVEKILSGEMGTTKGTMGERGYGLGLPMVVDNIRSLKGDIKIESQMGWGTNFEVTIPMV
ncbi:GAF domain-containing sensor histidine kinase [Pedobacter sp. Leaf132]|uniref:GAF domain-containing sensor histidine kinase n=1 Tax=Pedobacter sp. Leaf132 TaxID=2876557 RepID=UPI001E2A2D68|nr:GAF domain-containing sensor histidine kinase [Pedobacter sp. Leaf132]